MGLRESKGNMYTFVSHTWNPIRGACMHNCPYCYMKNFPQKPLNLSESELHTDLGKGNFIFVGSGTDMFAKNVSSKWIIAVLDHCRNFNNRYLFQSKDPRRFAEFLSYFPKNTVLGTTIESNRPIFGIGAPHPQVRSRSLRYSKFPTMLTIEPIMDFDVMGLIVLIDEIKPSWINIGADSKKNKLSEPSSERLCFLIRNLQENYDVHLKKNLNRLLPEGCSGHCETCEVYKNIN